MATRTKILYTALGMLTVARCAGTTHQIVPSGRDTYMVASHGWMGLSSAGAQKAPREWRGKSSFEFFAVLFNCV
jgi:hypothetical protein